MRDTEKEEIHVHVQRSMKDRGAIKTEKQEMKWSERDREARETKERERQRSEIDRRARETVK